uniref:Sacsin n=1 Tax=Panagrellus redivivus TaxID=6233 RepID=A0A7E4UUI9_PANRE
MPFPFSRLPYGHRQRLRELATSEEAYELQLVVGNDITGLQPIILLKTVNVFEVNYSNTVTFSRYGRVKVSDLPPNIIYAPNYHLLLHSVDAEILNGPVFDKVYLKNIRQLVIDNYMLTAEPLQKIAQKISPMRLCLRSSETNVLIPDVLSLFPNIRSLSYPRLYKGWARDLASVVKTAINFANCYTDEKLADVLDFDTNDIVQLLEKGGHIYVGCLVPDDMSFEEARREVEKRLGPKFTIISSETAWESPTRCLG